MIFGLFQLDTGQDGAGLPCPGLFVGQGEDPVVDRFWQSRCCPQLQALVNSPPCVMLTRLAMLWTASSVLPSTES